MDDHNAERRREIIAQHAVRELDNPYLADWLAALRSGDYRQAEGAMRVVYRDDAGNVDGTGFCCLGVACDLAQVNLAADPHDPDLYGVPTSLVDYSHNEDDHPNAARDLAHMPTWVRSLLGITFDDEKTLANLNDDGRPFAYIADVIELAHRAGMSADAAQHAFYGFAP